MNYSNLKTKLTVCPNVASLDLVTNSQLDSKLEQYVTEAPSDGSTYGRVNEEWVAVIPNCRYVYVGFSNSLVIDDSGLEGTYSSENALQIEELGLTKMDIKATEFLFDMANISKENCAWFCTSTPITSIVMADFNLPIAYGKVQVVRHNIDGQDVILHCYRTDKLVEDNWKFKIKF